MLVVCRKTRLSASHQARDHGFALATTSASRFNLLNINLHSGSHLDGECIPVGSNSYLAYQTFQSSSQCNVTREFGCRAVVVVDRKMCRVRGLFFVTTLVAKYARSAKYLKGSSDRSQFFAITAVARSVSGMKDSEGSSACIRALRNRWRSKLPKVVCAQSAVSTSYVHLTL